MLQPIKGSLASLSVTAITWSDYLDTLTNHTIRNFAISKLSWPHSPTSIFTDHADIVGIGILLVVLLISLQGVRQATLFNNLIAFLNVSLLCVISLGGLLFGSFDNLTHTPYTNGIHGILRGIPEFQSSV
jgi:amino acid transporter